MLTHVDYSDGTIADYQPGMTKWGLNSDAWAPVITWARDTHHTGPMQNIFYEYNCLNYQIVSTRKG